MLFKFKCYHIILNLKNKNLSHFFLINGNVFMDVKRLSLLLKNLYILQVLKYYKMMISPKFPALRIINSSIPK